MWQWQRARTSAYAIVPQERSRLLWVKVGPPERRLAVFAANPDLGVLAELHYQTHLIGVNGRIHVPAKDVELLSEFAEDVRPELVTDWWAAAGTEKTDA